jgi:hypothetical protein
MSLWFTSTSIKQNYLKLFYLFPDRPLGPYDDVKAGSIEVEAFDRRVATLDLPSLIRAKRASGREKDLSALAELESLLEAGE